MDQTTTSLQEAMAVTYGIVGNLTPDQLSAPTPCDDWDVRAVLNHLIMGNRNIAARVSGQPMPDHTSDFLGQDFREAFQSSGVAAVEAFAADGVLDRTFDHPIFGHQNGRFLARIRTYDTLQHGWDIASATGQPTDIAPELTSDAVDGLRPVFANIPRTGNPFGPEQPAPAGASPADKMAAFLGRKVS